MKSAYHTQQRKALEEFFESRHDHAFSVEEIVKGLGGKASVSAIYRNLSALEKEGKVRKTTVPGEREAYFQYVGCVHCHGHIHMTCVDCGATTHLDEEVAASILKNVSASSSFAIDPTATVLYGVCQECAKKRGGVK
ncbi:MAG: transcriptional repressor [Bacilli bacterium]|nr:transcriptional repressor [Bacilli bacterium]